MNRARAGASIERLMRAKGLVFAAAAGATILLLAVTAAAAGTLDRVQVGVSGRNATRGLSPALFVDVSVVTDYAQSKFDGEQGDWQGPTYTETQSTTTGRTDLSFRSDFESSVGSLAGMAQHALVHKDWTLSQKNAVKVPRLLAGHPVGAVGGELVLYQSPVSTSAQWESVLALPLCHGVFVGMDFYADAPPTDTSGTSQYLVGTTPARQWNHDHALAAPLGVKLDGPLPGDRIVARAAGSSVVGRVSDCGGGLQNVSLAIEKKNGAGWSKTRTGRSGPGGSFSLSGSGKGSYRVTARLGPFKATSGTVTITHSSSSGGGGKGRENFEGKTDQGERVALSTLGGKLILFNSIADADCAASVGRDAPFPVPVYIGVSPDYPHELPLTGGSFEISDYQFDHNTNVFSLKGHVAGERASGTLSGHLTDLACDSGTVHWTANLSGRT